jgi:hypothetical protein
MGVDLIIGYIKILRLRPIRGWTKKMKSRATKIMSLRDELKKIKLSKQQMGDC